MTAKDEATLCICTLLSSSWSLRLLPALVFLASCGRYSDFQLPEPGPEEPGTYAWRARKDPVLGPGAAGEWDAVDVLNPTVAQIGGRYRNLYSGFDGHTWHTGLAESDDGLSWRKQGKVISPSPATWEGNYIAANGALLEWGGDWLYWYHAGDPARIGLARSVDGRTWRKEPQAVLGLGPRGSWDERAAADPYVFAEAGRLYLYYLGQDRAGRQQIGVAASDDGLRWTKLRSNPVLPIGGPGSMDENGLGEPAVWRAHGSYWMLFTGRARNEVRRLGLARSRDGVKWHRTDLVISGDMPWDEKVICDPTVEDRSGLVRVWFGGGDLARPAENLHGQIGYGELEFHR
jgi:predicted GH43/DUF377 family glycosyl hydrolase